MKRQNVLSFGLMDSDEETAGKLFELKKKTPFDSVRPQRSRRKIKGFQLKAVRSEPKVSVLSLDLAQADPPPKKAVGPARPSGKKPMAKEMGKKGPSEAVGKKGEAAGGEDQSRGENLEFDLERDTIELSRIKREKMREQKNRLFRPIDIDESTSAQNSELYDFAMHSHSDSLSDGDAEQSGPRPAPGKRAAPDPAAADFFAAAGAQRSAEKPAAEEHSGGAEALGGEGGSFSDAEAEVAQLDAFCDETGAALDEEQSALLAERRGNDAELRKCEEWEQRFEQNYVIYQTLQETIDALCACLTEKSADLDSLVLELSAARQDLNQKHTKMYFGSEFVNKIEILQNFERKKQKTEIQSFELLKDVSDDLMLPNILQLFSDVVEISPPQFNFENPLFHSHLLSLTTPFLNNLLLRPLSDPQNRENLSKSLSLLDKIGADCRKKSVLAADGAGLGERVRGAVVLPFANEFVASEWDVFSAEGAAGAVRFVKEVCAFGGGGGLGRAVVAAVLERLQKTLSAVNTAITEKRDFKRSNIDSFLETFKTVIEFLTEGECFQSDANAKSTVKLIELVLGKEVKEIPSPETMTSAQIEEKVIELNFLIRSVLKKIDKI